MAKYYKLTEEKIFIDGVVLHRIECTDIIPGKDVKVGEKGGFIETKKNLYGNAWVYGDAMVSGNAEVCGNAEVYGNADYIVFKNWWSSGRYFTWTRSNNMWAVGCFYGTGEELIKKAYADSECSGREYKRVVEYVQSILEEK